jgi:hypothetical protein
MRKLKKRIKAPTPPFFKKIRNCGLVLGAACASVLAAPVVLPAAVIQVAGYLALAASVASAVSQTAVKSE